MSPPTSGNGTLETCLRLGKCLFIDVDRKSSAYPQNDVIDPKQTSGLTRHGSEMMHVRGRPMNCWGTGLFDLPVA